MNHFISITGVIAFVLVAIVQVFAQSVIRENPYLSGRQKLAVYQKDGAVIKGEYGFLSVPLSYAVESLGTMETFYRVPKPLIASQPTVLFFNGGPGGSSTFIDLENTFPGVNFVYMDQRGTGLSRPSLPEQMENPNFFNSECIARDAAELVKLLKVDQVTVFGASYGTIPATIFAHFYPEITRTLVLMGVVFDGSPDLWSSHHRIRILQRFFDRLPIKVQDQIISISQSGKVSSSWFSRMAQKRMYADASLIKFKKELEDIFSLSEAEQLAKIKGISDEISRADEYLRNDAIYGAFMFYHVACQELSATSDMSSWEAEFVDRKLTVRASSLGQPCYQIPGIQSLLGNTYHSTSYPVQVPVTYIQGTTDGATAAPNAIRHFKQVAKGPAQIILAKGAGHNPLLRCYHQDDQSQACPGQEAIENIATKAFSGEVIGKTDLDAIPGSEKWVIAHKKLKVSR